MYFGKIEAGGHEGSMARRGTNGAVAGGKCGRPEYGLTLPGRRKSAITRVIFARSPFATHTPGPPNAFVHTARVMPLPSRRAAL
ncbi:hypothetical protein GCM10007301_42580 [Azorhizobium oxalatiphilum]|uniref:Uncharacterized protein n=1 Tax=Azorhizobium oxalatiphilum TaxID=980631 RepID=A0A917C8Y9_9HYPH|nr:hypothetical protein GCM10007301_42580 [Azorhizobium oxalatiphilum]